MTPLEAYQLTASEIAEWVKAQQNKELERKKFETRVAYSIGILASMSLTKKRPTYDEMWQWPKDNRPVNVDMLKAQMIVWAENANKEARKKKK